MSKILNTYDLFKIAVRQMESQETLEGCKKIWERYPVFHRNAVFSTIKNQMKQKLSI